MNTLKSWRRIVRLWKFLPPWLEFCLIAIVAVIFITLGAAIVWAAVVPIPSIDSFENRQVAQSTKIFDRTGNIVLYDVHGTMRRTAVPLTDISPYVQKATIAVEDTTFYTNAGFRPLSFLRAMAVNVYSGSYMQGGSTITQQVVKNTLLTRSKTIARKIEEIILALRLTKVYSKDQILNTYLNEIPYGGTIYGVEEASQYYFGVAAKDVDLAQAVYLAALPQAPTYYSPYGNHRDALEARKNRILKKMKEQRLITDEEYEQARKEEVRFKDEREAGIKAPHFVFYIREYLEQKYGPDAVQNGGLRVISTLDYDLQQKAEDTVVKWAPQMQKNFNATNEGMVGIDPKTGQVLAMVGSRGYFDETIDGKVNVALASRQPGSSFKPFVYATAFQKGYTPETVVFDLPTQFSVACAPQDNLNDNPPCYAPSNFDATFKGPIMLRNALAQSVNIPSVKVLYLAGIKESIATARSMGITTLGSAGRYGLTLVLGGGEINLLEMTSAYGVFANDGLRNPPTGILRIEDSSGNILEEYRQEEERVLDPQIARLINDVLSDNVARTPEFGADSPLNFHGYIVADKTGTTNDYRDVWILGYTPGIAVGAWAGNNDNTPMAKKIAAFIVAPMWHDFMAAALEKYSSPSDVFPPPAPETNTALPPVLTGNWQSNPAEGMHDILYWINKDNPRGLSGTSRGDPQSIRWDYAVSLWASGQGVAQPGGGIGLMGTTTSSSFSIVSPQQGATIQFGSPLTLSISAPTAGSVRAVSYYVNGAIVGVATTPPSFSLSFTPIVRGSITIRAIVDYTNGAREEQTISITIN